MIFRQYLVFTNILYEFFDHAVCHHNENSLIALAFV